MYNFSLWLCRARSFYLIENNYLSCLAQGRVKNIQLAGVQGKKYPICLILITGMLWRKCGGLTCEIHRSISSNPAWLKSIPNPIYRSSGIHGKKIYRTIGKRVIDKLIKKFGPEGFHYLAKLDGLDLFFD
ncbi:MAG: hypothetical protein D3923_01595 [Candidatus Electrothrix sp. AR3]|nr:hypothetical protein [Candidatus Electrothrix sp. AR3]